MAYTPAVTRYYSKNNYPPDGAEPSSFNIIPAIAKAGKFVLSGVFPESKFWLTKDGHWSDALSGRDEDFYFDSPEEALETYFSWREIPKFEGYINEAYVEECYWGCCISTSEDVVNIYRINKDFTAWVHRSNNNNIWYLLDEEGLPYKHPNKIEKTLLEFFSYKG